YILIPSLLVFAQPMNRTIDDTYGDLVTQLQVTYSNNWHAGQTCGVCAVSPSQAQAYAGTWHDTTSDNPNSTTLHTATLQFNGPDITILTNASFELDGLLLDTFKHPPQPIEDQYLYNVLLFSMSALVNTEHTLVMTAVQGESPSLLLFDYAIYTWVRSLNRS
ncbi:hypothetical protein FOMPIDRAFT_1080825, partial [Fomitopsis schrenkii]